MNFLRFNYTEIQTDFTLETSDLSITTNDFADKIKNQTVYLDNYQEIGLYYSNITYEPTLKTNGKTIIFWLYPLVK